MNIMKFTPPIKSIMLHKATQGHFESNDCCLLTVDCLNVSGKYFKCFEVTLSLGFDGFRF